MQSAHTIPESTHHRRFAVLSLGAYIVEWKFCHYDVVVQVAESWMPSVNLIHLERSEELGASCVTLQCEQREFRYVDVYLRMKKKFGRCVLWQDTHDSWLWSYIDSKEHDASVLDVIETLSKSVLLIERLSTLTLPPQNLSYVIIRSSQCINNMLQVTSTEPIWYHQSW